MRALDGLARIHVVKIRAHHRAAERHHPGRRGTLILYADIGGDFDLGPIGTAGMEEKSSRGGATGWRNWG